MLTRRGLLGLAGLGLVAGCHPAAGRTPLAPTSPAGAGGSRAAGTLAATLRSAWMSGAREDFLALFLPSSRRHGEVLFDNTGLLGSFEVTSAEAANGETAEGRLNLRWRAGAEREPAMLTVQVIAGATSSPGAADPAPSVGRAGAASDAGLVEALVLAAGVAEPPWWRRPAHVEGTGPAWLVTSQERAVAARPWLNAAEVAVAHLRAAELEPWASTWDGTLVLEVPHDLLTFSSAPGVIGYTTVAAGGPRIVLNPTLLEAYPAGDRVGLLVHEGVHLVSGSPLSPAPLWAVEGLAESVATAVWPEQSQENLRLVRAVRATAPPQRLPTAQELRGDPLGTPSGPHSPDGPGIPSTPGDRHTAYALAEVAVEGCIARWGRAAMLGWLADWSAPGRPGEEAFTQAYLDELGRR